MSDTRKAQPVDLSRLFLFLWNLVNLFDLISNSETFLHYHYNEYYLPLLAVVSFVASLSFLVIDLSPDTKRVAILTFCITQVLIVIAISPDVPNHWLVAALVNIALIYDIWRSNSLTLSRSFIETAKLLAAIVYSFSFLHKLNFDFLNPTTSCSTKFASDLGQYYSSLSFFDGYRKYLPITTALVEGILATIYFLPRRLLQFAIAIGFVFHALLAIHVERHFFDFSSLMMSLLLLYLPFSKQIAAPPKFLRWFLGAGFIIGFLLLLNPYSYMNLVAVIQIRTRLWLIFAILISYYAIKIALEREEKIRLSFRFGLLNTLLICFVLVNGFTPYLGIKTRSAFDMYSNLRVEGGASNHLFIPKVIQPSLFTDDLVDVLEIKNPEKLYPWARPESIVAGKRIERFQLMSIMMRAPDLIVRIRDEQGQKTISEPGEAYASGWVAPWIMRKIIGFRPVNPQGAKEICQW